MDIFKPELISVIDPIIDTSKKAPFAILKGGSDVSERAYNANSWSTSSVQFSVPPPNPGTYVSRKMQLYLDFTVNLSVQVANGVQGTNGMIQEYNDALRSFPINSMIRALEVTINGCSLNLPVNEVFKPMLYYHYDQEQLFERAGSLTPALRDQLADYRIDANAPAPQSAHINPLSPILDGNRKGGFGRASFPATLIGNNNIDTSNDAVVVVGYRAKCTEPLFLSPLLFGGEDDDGFLNVQSLDINITWDTNPARLWSHNPGAAAANNANNIVTINAINWILNDRPQMFFRYVTPPLNQPIPRSIQYNYSELTIYKTQFAPTAPDMGQYPYSFNAISSNIQVQAIPRKLYVFVRRAASVLNASAAVTATTPDCYGAINNINVYWNNRNSLLASATQQQLYEMSRKNGAQLSWQSFSGLAQPSNWFAAAPRENFGIGSIICIEFGTDIGLDPDEAPGLIGTYSLQVQCTGTWVNHNYSNAAVAQAQAPGDLELCIITQVPGIFTIYDNAASKRKGVVSKSEILNAKKSGQMSYDKSNEDSLTGGLKFKKALRFFRKGQKLSKPILDLLPIPEPAKKALIAAETASMSAQQMKRKKKRKGLEQAKIANEVAKATAKELKAQGMMRAGVGIGGYKRKRTTKKRKAGRPKKK